MAKANDMKVQAVDTDKAAPATKKQMVRAARREFLRQALAGTSAVAISQLLPSSLIYAVPQDIKPCPSSGGPLPELFEVKSQGGILKTVIRVTNANRSVPPQVSAPASKQLMLRYFDTALPGTPQTATISPAKPGPTLRCQLGDKVQISLFNTVQVRDFPGTLDVSEEGRGTAGGCDKSSKPPDPTTGQGGIANFYPANDKYPNCFHGSSSANMHFHGTHVSPATTGDNVLVVVRPDPQMTQQKAQDIMSWFEPMFEHCELGHEPQKWQDLPEKWRIDQMGDLEKGKTDPNQRGLVGLYDRTAPYTGPGANPSGRGLPENLQLWPQNAETIAQGNWPQYYIGSYPICFQIPRYTVVDPTAKPPKTNVEMGQAPGTHWYHSHKHGSTSINLFNGLAGALIIEDNEKDGYDRVLKDFYKKTGNELDDVVLVFHQITDTINLMRTAGQAAPKVLVNGQFAPTIGMRPNQVKLFRMINATVLKFVNAQFQSAQTPAPAGNIQFRQTAQDGVQLAWGNYSASGNGTQPIQMSPANRLDLLVQAPSTPGCYVLQDAAAGPLLYINVTGTAIRAPMGFPTQQGDYPPMPVFLNDINPATIRLRREVIYGSNKGTADPSSTRVLGQFTIDGKQFEDQTIDQVMLLGATEEWKIINADQNNAIAHPFHIHVNPFQIVEVYDPTGFYNNGVPQHLKLDDPYKDPPGKNFVWWDTFGIPPAKVTKDSAGQVTSVDPGYFRMRTRFVDFTGMYVQHCHILAHEDRGMMQLLQVISNKTVIKHH